jgi:DNA-binding GntR family transcriptional regulator
MGYNGLLYDVTYQHIRRDIMDLKLEPGTALSVRKIAEQYKVGRTPAREALMRLQKEELVYIFPKSGTIVSKLSVNRIKEELFIRKTMELASIDDFMRYKGPLVTDAMEYIIGQQVHFFTVGKKREFVSQCNNFHRLIFEIAKKSLAWKTINMVSSHFIRFQYLAAVNEEMDVQIIEQHKQVLNAAKAEKAEKIREILRVHIDNIGKLCKQILNKYPQYFIVESHQKNLPETTDPTK